MPRLLPWMTEQTPLAPLTTLKIGGPAQYFAAPKTMEEISATVVWAKEQGVPWTVLGGGSNVLISDTGVKGLVIHPANADLVWAEDEVTAGAGTTLGLLIGSALRNNLGGLNFLVGVPGAVGGSVYGNAGSRLNWISKYILYVDVVRPDGTIERLRADECHFAYRTSIFKQTKCVIASVRLRLPRRRTADERIVIADMAKKKMVNQPTTASSAGCMFQNPKLEPDQVPESLREARNPDGTVSAWRFIAEVGLQGMKVGNLQISDKHANFLVNLGGGTADQAVQIFSLVKQRVRDTLGIQLHEEIQYLGF